MTRVQDWVLRDTTFQHKKQRGENFSSYLYNLIKTKIYITNKNGMNNDTDLIPYPRCWNWFWHSLTYLYKWENESFSQSPNSERYRFKEQSRRSYYDLWNTFRNENEIPCRFFAFLTNIWCYVFYVISPIGNYLIEITIESIQQHGVFLSFSASLGTTEPAIKNLISTLEHTFCITGRFRITWNKTRISNEWNNPAGDRTNVRCLEESREKFLSHACFNLNQ